MSALFPPAPRSRRARQRNRPVARRETVYAYTDEQGNQLFQTVRYEPGFDGNSKTFRQRRRHAEEGWIWGLATGAYTQRADGDWVRAKPGQEPHRLELPAARLVLYRLPALLQAHPSQPVFVVEGEKDADNVAALDLVATTNPLGAGKWRPEFSECLCGRHVIILADNDAAGRKHAREVARALYGVATSVRILELPGLPDKGDVSDWLQLPGNDKARLLHLANEAPLWTDSDAAPGTGESGDSGESGAGDARPTIAITTEEHRVNAEAIRALASEPGIYQRGGNLVRIVRDDSPAAKGIRRPLGPRIDLLPPALLRERLTAIARWVRTKQSKGDTSEEPAHPPAWCVAALHAAGSWPGIRHLEAIVPYPVLRPDGSLLSAPGYDPQTGLYLAPGAALPEVPSHPSRGDALKARDDLLDLVRDFPFQQDVHRAAWLAALLTPPARFACQGPAPLFLFDANAPATGKGLLSDVIACILTGARLTVATYSHDPEELRKRITSLVLAGDPLALFDNLVGPFGNGQLDAALTATAWSDRLLGGNRMLQNAPVHITWFASGNNVRLAGDVARRICPIRLEADCEHPEERDGFQYPNLLAHVQQHRSRLLAAALTIPRAYIAAGRPDQKLPAWGSFEGWSRLVRSAVVWVGLPDPGAARQQLRQQADGVGEHMADVLACLERLDPHGRGLTTAAIIDQLDSASPGDLPQDLRQLREALLALVDKLEPRALGALFKNHRRRIFHGRYLDTPRSRQGAACWAVYPASKLRPAPDPIHQSHDTHAAPPAAGDSGDSGESGWAPSEDDEPTHGPNGENLEADPCEISR